LFGNNIQISWGEGGWDELGVALAVVVEEDGHLLHRNIHALVLGFGVSVSSTGLVTFRDMGGRFTIRISGGGFRVSGLGCSRPVVRVGLYRGTLLTRKLPYLGPYGRPMPRFQRGS
jgi:hypothetical protein